MKNTISIRSSQLFKKMLDEVKIQRIKMDKDVKLLSDKRLTIAITRIPNIRKILMESEMKNE